MKKVLLILTAILVFGVSNLVSAQDDSEKAAHNVSIAVPSFALVDVEDASGNETDLSFSITQDDLVTEAGAAFNTKFNADETFYLQYTSLKGSSNNSITAEISASTMPTWMKLNLKTGLSAKSSSKKGKTGTGNTAFQEIGTTGSAISIVSGIGTCYTGTVAEDGHELTYQLELDFDEVSGDIPVVGNNYTATVTYTITEN
jgi:hypothetical protein